MIRTLADPWLAQNAGRKYPLADDVDTTIPDNAILDFRCTVVGSAVGAAPMATLANVSDTTTAGKPAKRIEVAVAFGDEEPTVLRFDIPKDIAHGAHHTITAAEGRVSGALTVTGHAADLENGDYGAAFARTTVTVDSLGVDSIQGVPSVSYDTDDGHRIDGPSDAVLTADEDGPADVVLDLGANTDPYLDGRRLRLEIARGGGRGEWCQVRAADQNCSNVLFTVNGERPGSDGDIRIVGEDGVSVKPLPDEHAIEISITRTASDVVANDCTAAC